MSVPGASKSGRILSMLHMLRAGKIHFDYESLIGVGGIDARLVFIKRSQSVADVLKPQSVPSSRGRIRIELVVDSYVQTAIPATRFYPNRAAFHQPGDAML